MDFIATVNAVCILVVLSLLVLSIVATGLGERLIIADRNLSTSFTVSSAIVFGAVVVFDLALIGIGRLTTGELMEILEEILLCC